jgi:DNA polymerase-3 subunit gamma/tau
MSYIALYREWRPTLFEDVVEQEHVVRTLRYSVSTGRIAHAYLFCGTRGTGKTTMAHILSRAINCLNPRDGDPCNECEVCREILAGSCVDVLEIDAASNNSVDNVRSIRDEVIYAPTKARRKVYIIDEVHMLSTGAFNALLKTLEEPPEHVVFILATTEPHKLPATILSRCQRFDFRRITHESIMKHLDKIASAVGTKLDTDAARLIARMSDGAMRDAISLLDQCISLGNGQIRYEDVLSVVGIVNDTFMTEFVNSMLEKNVPAILENIGRLVMDGRDIAHFVSDLVLYYRNLLICKATNGRCEDLIEVPSDVLAEMKRQAGGISQDEITYRVKELSSLETNLKWASNPRVLLEVTLIKLCGSTPPVDGSVLERLSALESRLNGIQSGSVMLSGMPDQAYRAAAGGAQAGAGNGAAQLAGAASLGAPTPTAPASPLHTALPDSGGKAAAPAAAETPAAPVKLNEFEQWPKIMEHLKSLGRRTIHSLLLNAKAISLDENNIGILFDAKEKFLRIQVSKPEYLELIEEAALKITGRKMQVKCIDEESLRKTPEKAKPKEQDELIEKARSIADKTGLPLEILDD